MSQRSETGRSAPGNDVAAFYTRLAGLLAAKERVALCTIVGLVGSGPRRPGAKMLVRASGELIGTVGGGLLEAQATTWAREILATGGAVCRSFAMDHSEAGAEGMTCGGEMEVLVERLDPEPGAADFFAQVGALASARGCLATAIRPDGDGVAIARALFAEERLAAIWPEGQTFPAELVGKAPATPRLVEAAGLRYFLEPLAPPVTVVLCGGGHIAVQLAPLCEMLGFRTIVVDDRADFASRERFPRAAKLIVAPSLDEALEGLPLTPDTYVIIVTRGHDGDQAMLRQALRGRPGYIGMIGSRRKRALVYEALAREGFTAADLARVACPIGLPIGAETPEEIAVSIVAQLIATRAGEGRRPADHA